MIYVQLYILIGLIVTEIFILAERYKILPDSAPDIPNPGIFRYLGLYLLFILTWPLTITMFFHRMFTSDKWTNFSKKCSDFLEKERKLW